MLAVGADHVVEQVITPKIHQLFLPKIIEVVHQYLDNEKGKLNKRQETTHSEKPTETIPKTTPPVPKTTVLGIFFLCIFNGFLFSFNNFTA